MFYVVQLDSDIFKEKIVVPSIWLDKYDTLCLLPPSTDVAEVETLAKAQSTPKHGWQMHSVSFTQSFDTYSQAKQNITKCSPAMINLEAEGEKQHLKEGRGKRKRKLPQFLEQYSIESDVNGKESRGSTQNCSMEGNAVLVPLIVKTEPMEDSDAPESHLQPQLNTTLNKSSSSVHSSLQHDRQLQVAGGSSSTISSLREAVKTFVQYALPNLNDSKMTTVTDAIIAEEPSELQDLIYFKEDDFLTILTKIQARKLMDFIQKSFSTEPPPPLTPPLRDRKRQPLELRQRVAQFFPREGTLTLDEETNSIKYSEGGHYIYLLEALGEELPVPPLTWKIGMDLVSKPTRNNPSFYVHTVPRLLPITAKLPHACFFYDGLFRRTIRETTRRETTSRQVTVTRSGVQTFSNRKTLKAYLDSHYRSYPYFLLDFQGTNTCYCLPYHD